MRLGERGFPASHTASEKPEGSCGAYTRRKEAVKPPGQIPQKGEPRHAATEWYGNEKDRPTEPSLHQSCKENEPHRPLRATSSPWRRDTKTCPPLHYHGTNGQHDISEIKHRLEQVQIDNRITTRSVLGGNEPFLRHDPAMQAFVQIITQSTRAQATQRAEKMSPG